MKRKKTKTKTKTKTKKRTRGHKFRSFLKARAYVRKLKLENAVEWRAYCKSRRRPIDIPSCPDRIYNGKGWKGLGDWLGTGRIASQKKVFLSFAKGRAFVRKLGLQTAVEWREYAKSVKRPSAIPTCPHHVYKDKGWKGLGDWLGTGRMATMDKVFLSFPRARAFARKLHLNTEAEWRAYSKSGKRPNNIPACPHHIYKDKGWKGMVDWLNK